MIIIVGIFIISRVKLFTSLTSPKKLLQVSDYITLAGGIEMFIFNIGKYVESYGITTKFHGIQLSLSLLKKRKGFFLLCTSANIISAVQIIYYSIVRKPDVIRFHSVSRYHGRLPILCTSIFHSKKLMMYHDLGYFHPFPSKITEENQVLPWSYSNRMKMANDVYVSRNVFYTIGMNIAVCSKFISILLLRWALRKTIDEHLVPSEFMVTYLVDWGIKKSSITVLPHFIAE